MLNGWANTTCICLSSLSTHLAPTPLFSGVLLSPNHGYIISHRRCTDGLIVHRYSRTQTSKWNRGTRSLQHVNSHQVGTILHGKYWTNSCSSNTQTVIAFCFDIYVLDPPTFEVLQVMMSWGVTLEQPLASSFPCSLEPRRGGGRKEHLVSTVRACA